MAGLKEHRIEAGANQSRMQPLRQRACLQANACDWQLTRSQEADQASGSLATFASQTIPPCTSTMHTLVSSSDTSNPA